MWPQGYSPEVRSGTHFFYGTVDQSSLLRDYARSLTPNYQSRIVTRKLPTLQYEETLPQTDHIKRDSLQNYYSDQRKGKDSGKAS